ncbi:MAG: hypothetical protein D6778_01450, partial [Nitrospirae bacterium]
MKRILSSFCLVFVLLGLMSENARAVNLGMEITDFKAKKTGAYGPDSGGGPVIIDPYDPYIYVSDHKVGLQRTEKCTVSNIIDFTTDDGPIYDVYY